MTRKRLVSDMDLNRRMVCLTKVLQKHLGSNSLGTTPWAWENSFYLIDLEVNVIILVAMNRNPLTITHKKGNFVRI